MPEPLNLGQDRMVSINQLADMIAAAAGVELDSVFAGFESPPFASPPVEDEPSAAGFVCPARP